MTPKEWRIAKKMTLKEMSEKLGISKGYLSLLENGKRMPSLAVIKAFEIASSRKITSKNFSCTEAQQ